MILKYRNFQSWHYWYFDPNNSLFWGEREGCPVPWRVLGKSLTPTHSMPIATPSGCGKQNCP